ncbi:uncharacterized protein PHACADRAFT_202765 [Phanerochaete carnosa HHB-10118-sp]|uniref:DUF6533 domain-containing protein n=1 Tax=Phanerochaete carnosa (strain HHB-10118-sp) TaxID=650164 RepID=K5WE81_PHACS|nr:uncharacterized protein PHACADRAFT_202765 [Phanerochaete carnosa HHB-10118-sp]EKM48477.1 hypothetical protein PHACADRAFT_202765 [Phanerochaete carnosa HHB-10118-sp]
MSAQSDQALVQAYLRQATGDYIGVAAACKYILYLPFHRSHNICPSGLVAYEFVITFGNEIEIVWKRPITARAVLLGSVRWCMLLAAVMNIAPETANAALFSALRVFAIWDRSYVWSLITFALSMVPFATNMHNAVMIKYDIGVNPLVGTICIEESKVSAQVNSMWVHSSCDTLGIIILQYRFMYTTRSSLIIADAIVLVLTWIKTFRHWRNARRLKMRASLTICLLRDGTMYFIALLALNISQLLTYNISDTVRPDMGT